VAVLGETPRAGLWIGAPLVALGLGVVSWPDRSQARVDPVGVALAVAGVVATALGVILAKPALGRSELLEATAIRLLIGALAVGLWLALTGRLRASLGLFAPQPLWRAALPATVIGSYLSMILWLGGIKYTLASKAALLNQMATVFLLVLAHFLGDPVPRRRWLGAAVALSGAVVVLVA